MTKELIEEVITEEVIEEIPEVVEEVIDMPEEEPQLDPEEIITEDFGVICKQDGEVTAYGFWTGTRGNVQRLEEWAELGYEKTSDKYVQGYDGKWYIEGTEPEKPAPTYEEVDAMRVQYRRQKIDNKTIARMRKQANETWTEEDEKAYLALDAEVTAYIEENYPYPK